MLLLLLLQMEGPCDFLLQQELKRQQEQDYSILKKEVLAHPGVVDNYLKKLVLCIE